MNKARIFPKEDNMPIIKQLYLIRCGAIKKDNFFNENNYKWCLGVGVISEIDDTEYMIHHSRDEKRTLFGIDVDIDYHNDFRMELWKNITNDV